MTGIGVRDRETQNEKAGVGSVVLIDAAPGHPLTTRSYLSGNFAPVHTERDLTPCTHTGTIPTDLAGGQYVRNGGNPVANEKLGREAHWFDGDGMLTGVLFRRVRGDNGSPLVRPEFVNRYLVTDVFTLARTSRHLRRPVLPSIATLVNPVSTVLAVVLAVLRTVVLVLLSRLPGTPRPVKKISVANTAVLYHDGRALATCESGPPLRFALPGLETIGWFDGRRAENESENEASPGPGRGRSRGRSRGRGRGRGTRPSKPSGFGGDGMLAFMKEWTTAHPRVDAVTGELMAFHSVFVRPFVYYSIVPPAGSSGNTMPLARFSMPVPGVAAPKMMHDFGVSRTHTVILDLPLSLDPLNMARGLPVLSYDAAGRARFGVFPRRAPERVRWFETKACCIFHTANTWDVVDRDQDAVDHQSRCASVSMLACRLTSASLVFSAGNLPTPPAAPVPPEYAEVEQCRLYYYDFPLGHDDQPGPCHIRHQWALSAVSFEFPSVAPDRQMVAARYVYGCSTRSASYTVALGKAAKIDFLTKVDAATLIARGRLRPPAPVRGCVDERDVAQVLASKDPNDPVKLFEMPPGFFAQEPRFVPRRAAIDEDDGWLLAYVFDEAQLDALGRARLDARSELWIIDAKSMAQVVATVKLPQRVPYGLHGHWYSEDDIRNQRPFGAVRNVGTRRAGLWDALRDLVERCMA